MKTLIKLANKLAVKYASDTDSPQADQLLKLFNEALAAQKALYEEKDSAKWGQLNQKFGDTKSAFEQALFDIFLNSPSV